MAKIIEFLAPVEAMRGDLSGGNKLLYGQNGQQSAFDAPGAAKNYSKKYIGNRSTILGRNRKGFSLKTRSTFKAASKEPDAVLGGAASLVANALQNLGIIVDLQRVGDAARAAGKRGTTSLRGYLTKLAMPQLKSKSATITFAEGSVSVAVKNPWISGGTGTEVTVPAAIVTKFNPYLGND